MKTAPKTIKASGSLKRHGAVDELEQTYRDSFKVTPLGGLAVSSERGESVAAVANVRADDVLEVLLENDVTLFTRRDDFEQDFPTDSSRDAEDGELTIRSINLGSPSRGITSWAIKILDIFRVDISEKSGLALSKRFEKQSVANPGLYKINESNALELTPAKFRADQDLSKPMLVFIHGTASNTAGSFGGLWESTNIELLEQLTRHYADRMFALEHWTLSQSPISNALDLVAALPDNSRLHLVSHSRGGIVGELVCRRMVRNNNAPFPQSELDNYNTRASKIVASLDQGEKAVRSAYDEQINDLQKLNDLLIQKNIRVEKFVRVACPARGTTLASERLDRWLSVFFNAIGLIPAVRATPYYTLLKNFIRALVKTRTKAHLLPGLEAQMPKSPLIALLNESPETLFSDLTVISGDTEREGILGQIMMLLPDKFYDSDHDLVVNTPSMYGGSQRRSGERYYFDQGDNVSHFNYFRNSPTASRVVKGLMLNSDDLTPYFTRQLPEVTKPIASRSASTVSGSQPVVFLLPGIMGSELDVRKTTIWAKKRRLVFGGLSKLEISDKHVSSSGLIGDSYQDLYQYLDQDNEVISFHYDWRTDLEVAASKLAKEIKTACVKAAKGNQPVSIIAHSMGGLLVRLMMAQHASVWKAMLTHPESRLIMLGTPNGGSHSIARLLFGHDKLIKGLALLDLKHSQAQLLDIVRKYPGVLLLLPNGDPNYDFFTDKTWKELAKVDSKIFAAPLSAQLEKASEIRSLISAHPLALEEKGRVLYIAGRADETPVALSVQNNRAVFKGTTQGDGRVPWATGIPEGIPTWYMSAQHGDLANHSPAFEAIKELLRNGHTELLPDRQPLSARGELKYFDIKPDEVDVYPNDEDIQAWALGSGGASRLHQTPSAGKINLRITHGNIAFSRNPVMVGHYLNDGIFSAEKYLDNCLDGRISRCYELGLYPDELNSAELILNSGTAKPAGALIVGLGKVGDLTVSTLSNTISSAMHRYAFDMKNTRGSSSIAVTSLLIGASTSGLPIQDAVMAILQGVMAANRSLLTLYPTARLSIDELQIMELWEDRAILATQAANYLFSISDELADAFNYEPRLEQVSGGQYRAFHEEAAGWWDRMQIEALDDGSMSFHNITNKARTEKRLLTTDREKVDQFIEQATASTWSNRALSKTLFEMLIPNELKDAAELFDDTVIIVNDGAARYPWELLEDRSSYSGKPLAIQNRIIRQLESVHFRRDPKMSSGNRALVIGEPHLTITRLWAALPGAAEEAKNTAFALSTDGNFTVSKLINTNSANIIKALHDQSYRVLHFAGHGVHNFKLKQALLHAGETAMAATAKENVSGMVIGNSAFLDVDDIEQIRRVPELVFINCCHLGSTTPAEQRARFPELAANLAIKFIRMGARAVVAAGWAVDDAAAKTFADIFYACMIQGKNFGEAVHQARRAVFEQHSRVNTWGAYQCYGDHQYQFDNRGTASTHRQRPAQTPGDLIDQLENLCKQAATSSDSYRSVLLSRVHDLLDHNINESLLQWYRRGDVCAAVGKTFGEFGHFEEAIQWYEKATVCEDAGVTVKTCEQYANLLVLHATSLAYEDPTKRNFQAARQSIARAIRILDKIDEVASEIFNNIKNSSVERECLRGSAYKRLAIVHRRSGAKPELIVNALESMQVHYQEADRIYDLKIKAEADSLTQETEHYYYAYTNYLTASILPNLMLGKNARLKSKDKAALRKLQKECYEKDRAEPGFWSMVSGIDCELVLKIADQSLPAHARRLANKYLEAETRAASPREFRSVIENIDFLIEFIATDIVKLANNKRQQINNALIKLSKLISENKSQG